MPVTEYRHLRSPEVTVPVKELVPKITNFPWGQRVDDLGGEGDVCPTHSFSNKIKSKPLAWGYL